MLGSDKEPLDFLQELQCLKELNLRKCFAVDESLEPLATLTALKRLSLLHLHRYGPNFHLVCVLTWRQWFYFLIYWFDLFWLDIWRGLSSGIAISEHTDIASNFLKLRASAIVPSKSEMPLKCLNQEAYGAGAEEIYNRHRIGLKI